MCCISAVALVRTVAPNAYVAYQHSRRYLVISLNLGETFCHKHYAGCYYTWSIECWVIWIYTPLPCITCLFNRKIGTDLQKPTSPLLNQRTMIIGFVAVCVLALSVFVIRSGARQTM